MTKPLLFGSHSSPDREFLNRLKDLLLEKTSGTIDIFLSCDGMSIPFGKNWVKEVEEALSDVG